MLPTHAGFGVADAEGFVGCEFTVTFTDEDVLPQELVAVTVYVPAWLVWTLFTDGFCDDAVKPLGPFQLHDVIVPFALPLKLTVLPTHAGFGVAEDEALEGGTQELVMQILKPPEPIGGAVAP